MAKPCRYQIPGQETWMSEQEFMQKLNDGLLDKFMSDNNIAIRNFKFTPVEDLALKFRAPVAETAPQAEVTPAEAKRPKNKREREDAALNGTMVYHRFGNTIYESTPEQYNNALKQIAETGSISDSSNIGKEISSKQAPDPVLHGYGWNLEKISQEDAQYELDRRTQEASTTEAPATQPTSEATDLNERLNQIKEERKAIRNDATLSQKEKSDKLKGLSNEVNEIFYEKQKQIDNEIDSKMGRPTSETKTEEISERTENFKNRYVESYFSIPKKNTAQRRRKRDYISNQRSSIDAEDRKAAELALKEIEERESRVETPKAKTTKTEPTPKPVAEVKETPKAETIKNDVESGADMLDKMSEEKRDNFIDDWFEDRIPRESLPGGSDAIRFYEARKVAPNPMNKPKRLTMDNAFELSNLHGFIINVDGEIYGLNKYEDPDATSDAIDRFGDFKEYVWAYTKIKDGINAKTIEPFTSDIDEVIEEIRSKNKKETKQESAKAEPKPIEEKKETSLERANRLINPMDDGESVTELGITIERDGDNYIVSKEGVYQGKKFRKIEALKSLSEAIAKSRAGENINIRNYDTEKVRGNDLKIGDIYSRVINGTRYVFKVLSKPYLPSKSARALGNMGMDVEVLHIGDYPSEMPQSDGPDKLIEPRVPIKVGNKTSDHFRKLGGSNLLGFVDKINNWETLPTETKVETKQESAKELFPSKETVSKAREKAETKETPKGAKVKAITQRGGNLEYTVLSDDGVNVTLQGPPRLKNPSDVSQGFIDAPIETLTIEENQNGERIAENEKGTTIYLDRVTKAAEPTLFETKETQKTQTEEQRGKKQSVTFALNTGRDITRFTPKVTLEKNRRTGEWELIKPDGSKMKADPELQNQAQLEYNKQNGIKEEVKAEKEQALEENKGDKEAIELVESDMGQDAAEALAEPTDVNPKPRRKRTKADRNRDYQATSRRGASNSITQSFIDKISKAFPDVQVYNDDATFQSVAATLGRSPGTAAILDKGILYLNPNVANINTAIEEYAHIYLLVMKNNNPNLYRMGIQLVRKDGKEYIKEVENDPGYAHLKNDPEMVAFEALSKMIADRGEKILDARDKSRVKEFIKDLWRNIYQFISGSRKIREDVDTIDSYVDKVTREVIKQAPLSSLTSDQLGKLQNKENIGEIKIDSPIIKRVTDRAHYFNRIFRANRGISQSLADDINKATNMIKIFENNANAVLKEFNKDLKEYKKAKNIKSDTDSKVLNQEIDRALKDSEFRDNWFASDPEAERLIKPSVDKMRSMIDGLSNRLKDSNLLTDDLELTINGNLDMYVNTSYMFYSPNYTGDWMDVFSETEKDQILDYFRTQRVQQAKHLDYTVNRDGSVNAKFENSFGDIVEKLYDNMDSFEMALSNTARYNTATGNPASKKLDVDALGLGTKVGKEYSVNFNQGLDISSIDRFSTSDSAIVDFINNQRKEVIEKKTSAKSFMFGSEKITDSQASKILKKKKNLKDIQKLLLKEVQDPEVNFLNTIRKQSELMFKRDLEKSIVDSGYLARATQSGNLTKVINKPGSLLNGLYVSPEMHDFLTNKRIGELSTSSYYKALIGLSAVQKALVTIASPGSNAANFVSGFVQTLMTGNFPTSNMALAMKALQEQAKISRKTLKVGKSEITSEDVFGLFFNTAPTVIRGIVNLSRIKPKGFKNGMFTLSDTQKEFYGVNNFDQLNDTDKARVILEELIENGAISSGIDSGIVNDLLINSFQNKELTQNQKNKITDAFKRTGNDAVQIAANTYQFSDSMFKAIVYLQEKAKRYQTYGSVMKQKGATDAEVEAEMRRMTAEVVKKQMPSYDRSPEFIKAISRFPLLGPFVQFDYQSKVNGFNILADGVQMIEDGRQMIKDGYVKEGTKLMLNGSIKGLMSSATWFMSYGISKGLSALLGGFVDDEDDETVRMLLPEYRRYSAIIHLDKNTNGQHNYIDISRVDPQSLYLKYFRAFKEDGVAAGIQEITKPYYTEDIFYGGLFDTFFNYNKYGNYDKRLERMTPMEKAKYFLDERVLSSTAYGQIQRLTDAISGVKQQGVGLDPAWEYINLLTGIKQRGIDLNKEAGKKLNYSILSNIETDVARYKDKLKQFNKRVENNEKITKSDKEEIVADFKEMEINANNHLNDARAMYNRLINLGLSKENIINSMQEANTPMYLIRYMLNPELELKYTDEGDRISGSSGSSSSTRGRSERGRGRGRSGRSGR